MKPNDPKEFNYVFVSWAFMEMLDSGKLTDFKHIQLD